MAALRLSLGRRQGGAVVAAWRVLGHKRERSQARERRVRDGGDCIASCSAAECLGFCMVEQCGAAVGGALQVLGQCLCAAWWKALPRSWCGATSWAWRGTSARLVHGLRRDWAVVQRTTHTGLVWCQQGQAAGCTGAPCLAWDGKMRGSAERRVRLRLGESLASWRCQTPLVVRVRTEAYGTGVQITARQLQVCLMRIPEQRKLGWAAAE